MLNSSVSKFRAKLLKEYKRLYKMLETANDKYRKELLSGINYQTLNSEDLTDYLNNKTHDFMINNYNASIKKYNSICDLLNMIDTGNYNNVKDFDFIETLLNEFNMTDYEVADVLAYVVNGFMLGLEAYFKGSDRVILDVQIKQLGNKRKNKSSKRKNKVKTEYLEELKNYARYMRSMIDKEGNILPLYDITEFKEYLTELIPEIKEYQAELIVRRSREIYDEELLRIKQAEEDNNKQLKMQQERFENKKQFDAKLKRNAQERKAAIGRLKEFIVGINPVRYLKEEEISEVLSLMSLLGYSSKDIKLTLKNIVSNNQAIKTLKNKSKIMTFKVEYLTIEENTVLDQAKDLICNSNLSSNCYLKDIADNYVIVMELINVLIDSSNVLEKEEYSLLKLGIEDIKNSIILFEASDFTRILNKESN